MSDLSDLSLVPLSGELQPVLTAPAATAGPSLASTAGPSTGPFAWPTPPLACYPAPSCPLEPEPCEIEGLNGRATAGRLSVFDPDKLELRLATPRVRAPIKLHFSQFRSLTLLNLLLPSSASLGDCGDDPLAARPAVNYQVLMREGEALAGLTVGHLEDASGLYLFEPTDRVGSLRRRFVPRAAFQSFSIGERIGDLLVQQKVVTPQAVESVVQEQTALRSRKIGDVLLVQEVLTPEQLEQALQEQQRMPMVRIGEALVALGFVSDKQLSDALAQQEGGRKLPLGELLVSKGMVSRQDLQSALARKMGYPMVDVRQFPVEAEALAKLPYGIASRLAALPLMMRGGRVVVALDDPSRRDAIDEIEFAASTKVVPVLAAGENLPMAIDKAYDRMGVGAWLPADGLSMDPPKERETIDASQLLASLEQQHVAERENTDEPVIEQSDNSLVRLINSMIQEAQQQGVSDIHIECQPGREKLRIRFRKDGQLKSYMELPHTYRAALIARLKIMCDLDISERRKPQDGKINFGKFQPGAKLELRVATIPTHSGLEDAVLRLLSSAKPLPLDKIQLSAHNLAQFKAVMGRPYGMVLCVGPTGSGKTTTLHSAMGFINRPDLKIWTAEDPIEITQPGLRQVQVNAKIDWTFAKALRAFLRADPDVVMVGEIRDIETAQMAIEASLTGHLVLSTLHTNSAAETVTRLLDMGMDPFNFADSLLAVLAQRLVRKLCGKCQQAQPASDDQIDEWVADYQHACLGEAPSREQLLAGWAGRHAKDGRLMFHRSPGCADCDGTGFRGRLALHELLVVSRELRHLIQTNSPAVSLLRTAQDEGMLTLRQDGIDKVLAGLTTIEEVRASSNG